MPQVRKYEELIGYSQVDQFKIAAQEAAAETCSQVTQHGFHELGESRGESAYLIQAQHTLENFVLGMVIEGLGTKALVADAMFDLLRKRTYFDAIAQDTVAMIVNDAITLGVRPMVLMMHLEVGSKTWFSNVPRWQDLISGWKKACVDSGCVWGCGETPVLPDVLLPTACSLSGAMIGHRPLPVSNQINAGDAIVMVESSGIGANGLTLAREIQSVLKKGYLTKLKNGQMYGEALLQPTHLYVRFIQACFDAQLPINYIINITGHGWRKLMRHPQPFKYHITTVPIAHPVFPFMASHIQADNESDRWREAFGTFNMGAGQVVILPNSHTGAIIDVAKKAGFEAWRAGFVHPSSHRRVIIEPYNIEFDEDDLKIR